MPVRSTSASPVLLTRAMTLFLLTSAAAFVNFYLLFAVAPLYAAESGGSSIASGVATGTMMAATVLAELRMPTLLARLGYRYAIGAGIVLLGAPTLLLPLSAGLSVIVLVSMLRGVGLAILVVAGVALAADLAPAARRGEALGLYGAVVSIPSILALPAGIWLAEHLGYTPVFLIAALAAALALLFLGGLPNRSTADQHTGSVLLALRAGTMRRPVLVFTATTIAAGAIVTFLPLAVGEDARDLATIALLLNALASTAARWATGRVGDRLGAQRLIVPASLVSAAGFAGLIALDAPVLVVAGAILFGIGAGVAQNACLSTMLDRVPPAQVSQISALWNLAFDVGLGIGAIGCGLLAAWTSYRVCFAIIAVVICLACVPMMREWRTPALAAMPGD